MAKVALVSFRLGLTDGVSVESAKWARALELLGHDVRTVAGEGRCDVLVPGLELGATTAPDRDALADALDDVECVIVENVCSLPLNERAAHAIAAELAGRPAVLHHHDLPWQRPAFRDRPGPPTDPSWRHVTINEMSRAELAERGIEATTIPNHFDLAPVPGDRDGLRAALGVRGRAIVVAHPTRAIPRKDVPSALRLAERLGAVYWLVGGPEDGFAPELDQLVRGARTGTRLGLPEGFTMADAYAAADVVVMSSTWEGFGNPVIESVAHRRPLARRRYPVMAEIEAHGLRFFDLDAVDELLAFVGAPDEAFLDANVAAAKATYDLALLPGRIEAVLQSLP